MRGIHIFEKPYYREIRPMKGIANFNKILYNLAFYTKITAWNSSIMKIWLQLAETAAYILV